LARAEDAAFSRAVRPADFSAAGLAKLSPEELARLDALVRDFKGGLLTAATPSPSAKPTQPTESNEELAAKLAEAKREAAIAERARVVAEAKAAKAEADATARVAQADAAKEKKSEGSLLAKAKVLLTPGTEVEYAAVESRIAGDFRGWEGKPIFTLENGQRWQLANAGSYMTPPIPSPKVKIVPSSLGGFWMMIEGVNQRVRVVPLGGGK
jgi:hypothetical protein